MDSAVLKREVHVVGYSGSNFEGLLRGSCVHGVVVVLTFLILMFEETVLDRTVELS
jgi:hypothetical protein